MFRAVADVLKVFLRSMIAGSEIHVVLFAWQMRVHLERALPFRSCCRCFDRTGDLASSWLEAVDFAKLNAGSLSSDGSSCWGVLWGLESECHFSQSSVARTQQYQGQCRLKLHSKEVHYCQTSPSRCLCSARANQQRLNFDCLKTRCFFYLGCATRPLKQTIRLARPKTASDVKVAAETTGCNWPQDLLRHLPLLPLPSF